MSLIRISEGRQRPNSAPAGIPINVAIPCKVGIHILRCVLCGREHWHGLHSAGGLVVAHCRNGNGATYRIVLEGVS